mmetsp:Transcript_11549/g.13164  ORF Transcript_11549/g.13164 Transcript_11549/m.13164 type:complete len:191 (+) Transcript_11549:151-723(+)
MPIRTSVSRVGHTDCPGFVLSRKYNEYSSKEEDHCTTKFDEKHTRSAFKQFTSLASVQKFESNLHRQLSEIDLDERNYADVDDSDEMERTVPASTFICRKIDNLFSQPERSLSPPKIRRKISNMCKLLYAPESFRPKKQWNVGYMTNMCESDDIILSISKSLEKKQHIKQKTNSRLKERTLDILISPQEL